MSDGMASCDIHKSKLGIGILTVPKNAHILYVADFGIKKRQKKTQK